MRQDRRPDRLRATRERRWRRPGEGPQPSPALLVALVLASLTLMTLDQAGDGSPLDPARRAAGEVFGPVEVAASTAIRPFTGVSDWFRTRDSMQDDLIALQAENSRLKSDLATQGYDRNRLEEYDGLTAAAHTLGYELVPARVVGLGPSQSFSRTVTIDGCEFREGLNAVRISGGVAGNVIPDECVVEVNFRFAPDRSEAQAQAHVREVFDGFDVDVVDSAPGALPGLDAAPAREFLGVIGRPPRAKLGWTDVPPESRRVQRYTDPCPTRLPIPVAPSMPRPGPRRLNLRPPMLPVSILRA